MGCLVVGVAGQPTQSLPYEDTLARIKQARRPLELTFRRLHAVRDPPPFMGRFWQGYLRLFLPLRSSAVDDIVIGSSPAILPREGSGGLGTGEGGAGEDGGAGGANGGSGSGSGDAGRKEEPSLTRPHSSSSRAALGSLGPPPRTRSTSSSWSKNWKRLSCCMGASRPGPSSPGAMSRPLAQQEFRG